MAWHSISNKPKEPGMYVVARFQGGRMAELHLDYVLIEGYWGPNRLGSEGIKVTHWMPWSEFRREIEAMKRDE